MTAAPARSAFSIRTERLLLRCYAPGDAPALADAIEQSREHLREFMVWARSQPDSEEAIARRLRGFRVNFQAGRDFVYAMFDPGGDAVLGGIGIHRRIGAGAGEIGYWVHAEYTGRGLCTEAAAAVTRVGFDVLALSRIEIHCDPRNLASAAIPRKLGYTHQVTVAGCVAVPTIDSRDTMFWTMLRGDFVASPAAAFPVEAFDEDGRPISSLPVRR